MNQRQEHHDAFWIDAAAQCRDSVPGLFKLNTCVIAGRMRARRVGAVVQSPNNSSDDLLA